MKAYSQAYSQKRSHIMCSSCVPDMISHQVPKGHRHVHAQTLIAQHSVLVRRKRGSERLEEPQTHTGTDTHRHKHIQAQTRTATNTYRQTRTTTNTYRHRQHSEHNIAVLLFSRFSLLE